MEDVNLRLEFHRALDVVTPPAPWLGQRVRDELGRRRRETLLERMRRRPAEFAWLIPALAVILAIAIIIGALVGHRFSLPIPVPVFPHSATAVGCPTWGYVPGGAAAPASIKMLSTTVGWAPGDLRTIDGGANWRDVSPKELRSGAPFLPGQQTVYPPSYSDFFLDADHAWLVRSYSSDKSCIDTYGVFRTTDGGKTWREATIQPRGIAGQPQPVVDFIDPQHGWLLLAVPQSPTRGAKPAPPIRSQLYATADGGQSWRRVSTAGPPCPNLVFVSPSHGYSGCGGLYSQGPLYETADGGTTWQPVASVPGCTCSIAAPVFFDRSHGAAIAYNSDGDGGNSVLTTSDGGTSWRQTMSAQSGSTFAPGGFEPYAVAVWFEDEQDFWLFTTQPGWGKGTGPATDWLYHSSDGGASWQLVQKNTPVDGPNSVSFVDPSNGFVLQADANGATQIMVTTDGGHTWKAIEVHMS